MKDSLTDYSYASARIKALERSWQTECEMTERRRAIRYVNVTTEQMRARGDLPPDGVYIPRRIAHNNIRREQAPVVAYYTQSKNMARFRPHDNLPLPVDGLEQEFTKFSQHDKWEMQPFQSSEGAAMHGWDAIETVFDENAPGHFRNRHLGHEHLWFAWDSLDIQQAPLLIAVYPVTTVELGDLVDEYGFAPAAAEEVFKKLEAQEDKTEIAVRLFKIYFKEDGLVYMGWWSEFSSVWLDAPKPLYLGVGDKTGPEFETEYPIEIKLYAISEDMTITNQKGRVFEDEPDQEACTQLATSFVNRAIRSQYLMFTPNQPTDDPAQQQTEIKIKDGLILKNPMKEFSMNPPNPEVLGAMTTFINQNANDQGQVNFASKNNRDTRQTAAAVHAAQQQGTMLNSVQVVLESMFWKAVLKRNWRIVQSQVIQGKLQSSLPNWQAMYDREYTLLSAGDIDVIRRNEILQAMKQDWPVMQTTPAAPLFLQILLRLSPYAEYADQLIAAMQQGDQKNQLIQGMANALQTVTAEPGAPGQLNQYAAPHAPALMELKQAYEKVMTPPGQQPQEQQDQPQEQAAA